MASYAQIRINKTKELAAMLKFLKNQLRLLSESDIMKLALSELYAKRSRLTDEEWMETLPTIKLTEDQEKGIEKSMKEYADGKYTELDPFDDESWAKLNS